MVLAADEQQRERLRKVAEVSAERLQRAGLTVDARVIEGSPRRKIIEEAELWHAGSIFVGARGLGALDRLLLGSVSSVVVTQAHCTVEVVRRAN